MNLLRRAGGVSDDAGLDAECSDRDDPGLPGHGFSASAWIERGGGRVPFSADLFGVCHWSHPSAWSVGWCLAGFEASGAMSSVGWSRE